MFDGIPADLIVIAAAAVYVIVKYKKILGEKTGHDVSDPKEKLDVKKSAAEGRVVQLHQYQDAQSMTDADIVDESLDEVEDEKIKRAIDKMKATDVTFTLDSFLQGSKGAFEMLMEAFNKSDRGTLKMLLSEDLYKEFDQSLKEQEKAGKRTETTLVSIISADVVEASFKKNIATLTVAFLSEQIQVVKNEDGEVIEGDASRIDQVEDEWVFERDMRSRNPNWTITDM